VLVTLLDPRGNSEAGAPEQHALVRLKSIAPLLKRQSFSTRRLR
jgi:hypothetical protein